MQARVLLHSCILTVVSLRGACKHKAWPATHLVGANVHAHKAIIAGSLATAHFASQLTRTLLLEPYILACLGEGAAAMLAGGWLRAETTSVNSHQGKETIPAGCSCRCD